MKIALVGGHGKVALLTTPLLVDAGHSVTSIIRNPDHAKDVEEAGATAKVTDIEKLDQLGWNELLNDGFDAVVWSAGAGGDSPERTWAVDFDAAKRSMSAALRNGVSRYVMVSYMGASLTHDIDPNEGFWHYAQAKAEADALLRGSNLDYTILGPSALTLDEPTGNIAVLPSSPEGREAFGTPGSVSRGNVARAIVEAIDAGSAASQRTLEFTDGNEPIEGVFVRH